MKFIITILFANILLFSQTKEKPLTNSDEFLTQLEKVSNETKTITADFIQTKELALLKEPQITKGKFYYKQNNKMRLQQTSPYNYIMLVNQDAIKIKDDDKEKKYAMNNMYMTSIKNMLMSFVSGKFNESKEFSPSYFQDDTFYIVKLTPKVKRLKKMFNQINLSFNKNTLRLKHLVFLEKSGDKNTMTFNNAIFNKTLEDKLFTQF